MSDDEEFDFLKADPSIKNQLIRSGVAMLVGFVAEALAKAAYDRFVINRHRKEIE